jgi:large subunit ribosomal protein L28
MVPVIVLFTLDVFALGTVGRAIRFPRPELSGSIRDSQVNFGDWSNTYMALMCEICGKKPSYGNVISHAHNVRRRRWNPNLRRVKAVVNGVRKQVRVCTSCIRSGRVKKAA